MRAVSKSPIRILLIFSAGRVNVSIAVVSEWSCITAGDRGVTYCSRNIAPDPCRLVLGCVRELVCARREGRWIASAPNGRRGEIFELSASSPLFATRCGNPGAHALRNVRRSRLQCGSPGFAGRSPAAQCGRFPARRCYFRRSIRQRNHFPGGSSAGPGAWVDIWRCRGRSVHDRRQRRHGNRHPGSFVSGQVGMS
jgi:hypothetical protein